MPNWKKVITSGSNATLNNITASRLTLESSGSTIFDVVGSQGQLFSITDSLSGSLFAVSDISGLPILEVFSDDTVKIGSFNNEAIIVSGSNATITGSFTGSFTGDGSNLTGVSSNPFPYIGSAVITGSNSLADNYALKVTNTSGANILNVENDKKVIINSTDIPSTSLIIGNPPNPNYNIEIASGSYNTMRFASNTNNGGEHKIGFAGHTSTTNMGAAIIGKATGASGKVNLFFALGVGDNNEADTTDSVITLAYNDINFYQPVHAQDDLFEIGGSNTGDSILYLGAERRIGVARDYRGAGNAADFVVVTPGTLGGTSIPTTHTRLRVTKEGNTELSGSLTANQGIDVTGDATITGNITTNTLSNISTTLASDTATNVDTFATATYTGAIYDYILIDATVGARAGQFMVAQDNGNITFTDTSTKHLTDSPIPEITAQINGANVEVQVTNGNGYTFKSFIKKL